MNSLQLRYRRKLPFRALRRPPDRHGRGTGGPQPPRRHAAAGASGAPLCCHCGLRSVRLRRAPEEVRRPREDPAEEEPSPLATAPAPPRWGHPLRRSGGAGAGSLDSPAAAAAGGVVSSSPLWQRRILMGERCELPRFSGLILYDERGLPLRISADPRHCTPRAEQPKVVATTATTTTSTTTLRDLL
ncbi:unnamed protein product [Spirodela intermedia]|uniref:Uncharacterized protein n=1 Tax=Spirodela intermedia TaxID=51605 RepID=A0A7I8JSU3_SPIIN|nr:unnamed protein product [Spirodela intermedia]CAA6673194.1 unnamed protein product [Spirodela intermedia]